ncbi:MAG: DUF3152 domain-containing protein [Actinomycetales bacterium]
MTTTRPRRHLRALLAVPAALALLTSAPPAAASGEIGGSGAEFFLDDQLDGTADHHLVYGRADDAVLVGDWDGDGSDTLAVRRGQVYHLRNSLTSGPADTQIAYGRAGDTVLVGDWDGDGTDTLAVRRGNRYFLSNTLTSGDAETELDYGRAADTVLVGDWDGDGTDTLAVRRGNRYFLSNTLTSGDAETELDYGRAADTVLVGDWDGDGTDTLAVRRGVHLHLSNSLVSGDAERSVSFGRTNDTAFAGDWDGDGADTAGLRRPPAAPTPPPPPPAPPTNGGLVGDPPWAGSGTFVAVPGSVAAPPGAARTVRVRIETERGISVDRPTFGDLVMTTLNASRGWGRHGAVSFARTDGPADVVLRLTTPATVDRLCYPLNTQGYTSCRVGSSVVINAYRWAYGAAPFTGAGGSLTSYRDYVVNHEVGHFLGHGHVGCPGPGRVAPVMQQQTLGMQGCVPNGWPYP